MLPREQAPPPHSPSAPANPCLIRVRERGGGGGGRASGDEDGDDLEAAAAGDGEQRSHRGAAARRKLLWAPMQLFKRLGAKVSPSALLNKKALKPFSKLAAGCHTQRNLLKQARQALRSVCARLNVDSGALLAAATTADALARSKTLRQQERAAPARRSLARRSLARAPWPLARALTPRLRGARRCSPTRPPSVARSRRASCTACSPRAAAR